MLHSSFSEAEIELLVRMIIHDLNTPLAVISRVLDRMQIGKFDLKKDNHLRLVRISSASLERTVRMLKDMQEVLATRSLPVHFQTIELNDLIEDIAAAFSPLAASEGRHFEYFYENCGKTCTDPDIIHRVIDNFLINALRHTASGKNITLYAKGDGEGGYFLSVKNTGDIIPEEHLENIFQPGVQLNLKNKKEWRGYGLGLAFCRLAAEALGGVVKAENLPDKSGVIFSFELKERESKENEQ